MSAGASTGVSTGVATGISTGVSTSVSTGVSIVSTGISDFTGICIGVSNCKETR